MPLKFSVSKQERYSVLHYQGISMFLKRNFAVLALKGVYFSPHFAVL